MDPLVCPWVINYMAYKNDIKGLILISSSYAAILKIFYFWYRAMSKIPNVGILKGKNKTIKYHEHFNFLTNLYALYAHEREQRVKKHKISSYI